MDLSNPWTLVHFVARARLAALRREAGAARALRAGAPQRSSARDLVARLRTLRQRPLPTPRAVPADDRSALEVHP